MNRLFDIINNYKHKNVLDKYLVSALDQCVTLNSLHKYLDYILSDEKSIRNISKYSYVHQLGFEKYVLFSNSAFDTIKVRLHIWSREFDTRFEKEIHDHCHNVTSKIVIGHLRHQFFEPIEKEKKYRLYEYRIDNKTKISRQDFIRNIGAKNTSFVDLQEGQVYSLNADILHYVESLTPISITVLLQGPLIKSTARVLKKQNIKDSKIEAIGIHELSVDEVVKKLSVVNELIKARI